MKKHELLSPAGSADIAKAVIRAGADAVYLGSRFGARAYARNVTQEELFELLDFAHIRDRKVFLTVNTLLKNPEIEKELFSMIEPLYLHGLDGVIVQDIGVLRFLHHHFPLLCLHASTQMSVTGAAAARLLTQAGVSRVVPARELSLSEIRHLYEETGIEIECFVHGALCYCYSGQCLFSSMIGGRSGNRGRCAQPCRLEYHVMDETGHIYKKKYRYPLSPKDLCAIEYLDQISDAGVYSFKIEGRMKQAGYAANVTAVYRKYVDLLESGEAYAVDSADLSFLLDLGNREGFTNGYYFMHHGPDMLSRSNSSHISAEKNPGIPREEKKKSVDLSARIRAGQPAKLRMSCDFANEGCIAQKAGVSGYQSEGLSRMNGDSSVPEYSSSGDALSRIQVVCTGDVADAARKQPLSEKQIAGQLERLGDTPFAAGHIEVETDQASFLSVASLNRLRRDAAAALSDAYLERFCRSPESVCRDPLMIRPQKNPFGDLGESQKKAKAALRPKVIVSIDDARLLDTVLSNPYVDAVDLDLPWIDFARAEDLAERIHAAGKLAGYGMPCVFREHTAARYMSMAKRLVDAPFDRYILRSYDSLAFAKECGIAKERRIADYLLYVFSDIAADTLLTQTARITASPELNAAQLSHMDNTYTECIIYGRIPLMVSAQCIYDHYDRCGSEKNLELSDRLKNRFPVKKNCADCYNIIENSRPVWLLDQGEKLSSCGFGAYRLLCTQRENDKMAHVLSLLGAFLAGEDVHAEMEITRGHFKRGVE